MLGRAKGFIASLSRTRRTFFNKVTALLGEGEITEDTWEELESLLIQADLGVNTALQIVESLRHEASSQGLRTSSKLQDVLRQELVKVLSEVQRPYLPGERLLSVVLVVGVNGSGKTTSIAKLAKYHQGQGDQVIVAAADTFRAAAIDQIKIWGDRLGVEVCVL